MKKSLILGILGLTAAAASSYGQGFINLDNYNSTPNPLVTYGASVPTNGVSGAFGTSGAGLNRSWTVGLYFAVGNDVGSIGSDPGNGIPNATLTLGTGNFSTVSIFSSSFDTLGEFAAAEGWNSGSPVGTVLTVEVVAYDSAASSYATA